MLPFGTVCNVYTIISVCDDMRSTTKSFPTKFTQEVQEFSELTRYRWVFKTKILDSLFVITSIVIKMYNIIRTPILHCLKCIVLLRYIELNRRNLCFTNFLATTKDHIVLDNINFYVFMLNISVNIPFEQKWFIL